VYDWLLSKDGGQSVIATHDQIGPRTDTEYPHKDIIAAAKTVVDYGPDLLVPDKVPEYGKTFEDLFVRK